MDSNSIGRRHPSRRQKSPCGAFLDARLAQSTRAHQELQYPNRVLEFRNVYRDSGTCRNKVSRAWCSWRSKKLFASENKSAPGCSSLEEELSGGCYWMHFIFAGAFSSGHCSRMFPAFCPGPDTRRGCRRSVWLVEAELSALVQQALVHITGDDLRQKQIMAAQRDDLRHLALKIQRAFL